MSAHPMQTPMQNFFNAQHAPNAPGRPAYAMHRTHPSLAAHMPMGQMPPPSAGPMTPGFPGAAFPGQPPFGATPLFGRNRRRGQSVSIGGPPKAPLGGPGRKHSPKPPVVVPAPVVQQKQKKIPVNLPKETVPASEDGEPSTRVEWARYPLVKSVMETAVVEPPVLTSAEVFPTEDHRRSIPDTIDVFLPGKLAWETIKRREIEEKLEKLGVERGSGSAIPTIHAPRGRAASISSPADPSLLYFKLNKLQQSRGNSSSNSLASSPQPPGQVPNGLSPSPGAGVPPRFQPRSHGHSMSLAQPSAFSQSPSFYNPTASFNPFGPNAVLGSDQIEGEIDIQQRLAPIEGIHAPQGRVPFTMPSLAPPPLSRGSSRPDFARGFGAEIPEEDEQQLEDDDEGQVIEIPARIPTHQDIIVTTEMDTTAMGDGDMTNAEGLTANQGFMDERTVLDAAPNFDPEVITEFGGSVEGLTPMARSRIHSRHVSGLSNALSLHSVGGVVNGVDVESEMGDTRSAAGEPVIDEVVERSMEHDDTVGEEWTGSEDHRTELSDDEESIGEWSNPSDEERARQERVHRRMLRQRKREIERPRRLPKFPSPPRGTFDLPGPRDYEIVSNPSEDGMTPWLPDFPARPSSTSTSGRRPLPPLPHSRGTSVQLSAHDPALAHSRAGSEVKPQSLEMTKLSGALSMGGGLNPNAKPFVFGGAPASAGNSRQGSQSFAPPAPPAPPAMGHTRVSSFTKPLSATASEFKPTGALNAAAVEFKPAGAFTFKPPPGVPQISFLKSPEPSRPLPLPPAPTVKPSPARAQQGREKRQRRVSAASLTDVTDEEDGDSGKENMASFRFPAPSTAHESPLSMRRSAPASPRERALLDVSIATSGHRDGGPLQTLTMPSLRANLPLAPLDHDNFVSGLEKELSGEEDGGAEGDMEDMMDDMENDENVFRTGSSTNMSTLPTIVPSKSKRAPIPLDFKNPNPSKSNTVPAGLFKALMSDEKTRRTVRSRLDSRDVRDVFESHSQAPSLDDAIMPSISHAHSRQQQRYVTDPLMRVASPESDEEGLFLPPFPRRSSLPTLGSVGHTSDLSNASMAVNLTKQFEYHALEQKLEVMLDDRFRAFQHELRKLRLAGSPSGGGVNPITPATEDAIAEVVGLFRAQLQESAARGLDDSQMDARGELDLELIKDIIQQGHADALELLRGELHSIVHRVEAQGRHPGSGILDAMPMLEQMHNRHLQAVLSHIGALSSKIDSGSPSSMEQQRQAGSLFADPYERDLFTKEVVDAISPMLAALQAEKVDYDFLTEQLSQAVKPNLAQLIDLAADKRETAGLIVDSILPLLPSLSSLDTSDLVTKITAEVRRVIAPIDAHEIKEQVADLVVERLDSRLAVRDRAFTVDGVASKVSEHVADLVGSFSDVSPKLERLLTAQEALTLRGDSLVSAQENATSAVSDLNSRFADVARAVEALRDVQPAEPVKDMAVVESMQRLQSVVDSVLNSQNAASGRAAEILAAQKALQREVVERASASAVPETFTAAVGALQAAQAEFAMSREAWKQEAEEIRKLRTANADLQVQLAKARGAHGQIRVEKDMIGEKLRGVEREREKMLDELADAREAEKARAGEVAGGQEKARELEEALAKALERLKASDVAAQANQERMAELERVNKEAAAEQALMKSKVDELHLQNVLLTREKEAAAKSVETLQNERESLLAQQSHWEELHRAAEQIQMLTTLIGQADTEELNDLRRARDSSKALETEHAALQRKFRDLEHKFANNEKVVNAARQNMTQAQQRSSEWERRAKEYEGDLERTRTELDQMEQTYTQLDADHSLAKLQLEEKDADDRLAKDRESKLKDQVAGLEAQVAQLQAQLTKVSVVATNSRTKAAPNGAARYPSVNSRQSPPRPDSRASTVYGSRAGTPVGRPVSTMNGSSRAPSRADTPPTSVWDSMHAPGASIASSQYVPSSAQPHQPQGRYPHQSFAAVNSQYSVPGTPRATATAPHARRPYGAAFSRPPIASPTPSNVSATPTQGDDGWWS
ncbi:hypothetical protein CONPUDRAFT_114402 [Coniophora puteana RWD-64-598 SS2]|uniref:Uncharacterized protein n=1 Tax=Coniophora puteana (strain RWD-64-598) TaxID=741705 RepID=A0A5M3N5B5_CONPW|nr:uncharacterized protein CONPUDRAFT_114402 [Coniophora puteana RWD-64-598 SS2]EIW86254.1 hypothetical protein CONPUDRAFT_114402 [Coniophora puteana RWD-64-598 SS2]